MIESLLGARKARRIYRFVRHCKVTVLCLLLTVVVLRGTIGAGKFGTPEQDFVEIRNMYSRKHGEPHRLLEEVGSFASSYLRGTTDGAYSKNYVTFNYAKLFSDIGGSVGGGGISGDKVYDGDHEYSFGSKISNWDEQRMKWLKENPGHPNFLPGSNKPRVLLVTGSSPKPCENPVGDHYLLRSIKNKMDYCRLHGIDVFYNMALLDAEMSGFWAKLPLIRRLLLAHPGVEFFWWMDSDAMFTDMSFELPWERYRDYNLVMHGWKDMVYEKKDWIGLNTGSFLIRNCQWSLDLLDAWAPMGPKGKVRDEAGRILSQELKNRPPFEADDQSAMVYLLLKEREKWSDKVYLENAYYLHGYWGILVDRYEEMIQKYHPGLGDHQWPLVTHFVGCKPCGKVADYPVERCLQKMDRAFNFADNQILKMYGFTHNSLSSRRVKRIQDQRSAVHEVNDEIELLHQSINRKPSFS